MPSDDFISLRSSIRLELNPALNILNSMIMLSHCSSCHGRISGIQLADQEKKEADIIFIGLYHGLIPDRTFPDFPAFLNNLSTCDPFEIRNRIISAYRERHDRKTGTMKNLPLEEMIETILATPDSYLRFLAEGFEPDQYSEEIERAAYELLKNPQIMRKKIHDFLSFLWKEKYEKPWKAVKADLSDFLEKTDISYVRNMSREEAISHMTGMEIDPDKLESMTARTSSLVFVPSFDVQDGYSRLVSAGTLYVFFNPEAFEKRRFDAQLSDINEISRKLSAIADTNRLNVLKYIAGKGEACSQDILKDLGFSQSAVSRHLQQLSATGILSERRQISAKYFRVNGDYLRNVLASVTGFLGV